MDMRYSTYLPILCSLSCPNDPLLSHNMKTLPGPQLGHQRPQLTLIPTKYPGPTQALTKIPQHTSASSKIYPIGVGPRSIHSSRRRSSRSVAVIGPNQSDPQPNISNSCRCFNNLHQVAITLLARRRYYAQLSPIYTDVAWIVSNYCRNTMKYFQPIPGILNSAQWPPWNRLKYWLPVVLQRAYQRISSSLWAIEWFFSFKSCVTGEILFNVKINNTRWSYRLMLILWLTLSINPRSNCLNTTLLS